MLFRGMYRPIKTKNLCPHAIGMRLSITSVFINQKIETDGRENSVTQVLVV